jgi:hypothetical protein
MTRAVTARSQSIIPPIFTYLSVTPIISFAGIMTYPHMRTPDNHQRSFCSRRSTCRPANQLYDFARARLTQLPLLATYLTLDTLAIAISSTRSIRRFSAILAAHDLDGGEPGPFRIPIRPICVVGGS